MSKLIVEAELEKLRADELTAEAEADRLFLENHRLRARIAELEIALRLLKEKGAE